MLYNVYVNFSAGSYVIFLTKHLMGFYKYDSDDQLPSGWYLPEHNRFYCHGKTL